jgi:phage I-like protein
MPKGDYLIEDYVSVTPGEPYRLFPFGKIVKGGKVREITPALAAQFRLPHFKPPIKRGSHADDAPAGGHIKALEVRPDGLYAIPEFNEKGAAAIADGDYRYHSPEVIWGDGPVFEDPTTGQPIHGPLIVGDALLHMPHLGEAAALYSVEPIQLEGNHMTEQMETVQVPMNIFERFSAWLDERTQEPKPEPTPADNQPEDYEALIAKAAQADKLQAEIDRMKTEAEQAARIEKYTAAVAETKANGELAAVLAGLEDDTADRIVQEFKALSEQIKESNLLGEIGTEGDGLPDDPVQAYNAAVQAKAAELKVSYQKAAEIVAVEAPQLAKAYLGG